MLNTGFSPWPNYSEAESEIAQKVILSNKVNYWTGGEGRAFEKEFADFVGVKHAVAVSNGTVALELALVALDIGPGDEVVVPSRTFLATVSAVVARGAIPVFADVDLDSQALSVESIIDVCTSRTKAVIVVHLSGVPADMVGIMKLAEAQGLYVIEDCAQAHGGRLNGQSLGSFGDVAAWSFCQDKIMTTAGEGGMVTTNNSSLWESMWAYKDHGKSWSDVYEKEHPPGFRWLHRSFGTNWRLTEIQAAIGRYQLKQMPDWHERRQNNATLIRNAAKNFSLFRVPENPEGSEPAWYKCYLFVNTDCLKPGWSRDRIIEELNHRGVPCYSGSCSEVYLEKAFDDTGWRPEEALPNAKRLGEESLMFLVHPTLSEKELQLTVNSLCDVATEASL